MSSTPPREFEFSFRSIADRVRSMGKKKQTSQEEGEDVVADEKDSPSKSEPSLADELSRRAKRVVFGRRQEQLKRDEAAGRTSGAAAAAAGAPGRRQVGGADSIYARGKRLAKGAAGQPAPEPQYLGTDASGEALISETQQDKIDERTEHLVARMQQRTVHREARKRWNAPFEHKYSTAVFRISPQKLQLLADQISGKPIDHAILQMQFSEKKASQRIKSTLCLARDHAIAKGIDRSKMVVSEAWVNKGDNLGTQYLNIMGRGRFGMAHHRKASLHIVLRHGKLRHDQEEDRLEKARRTVRSIGTGGVARTSRPLTASRPAWGY